MKCTRPFALHFSHEHPIATGGEESVKCPTAEAEPRYFAVGCGDDALGAAILIADLDTQPGGHEFAAILRDAQAIGAAVIRSVGNVQPIEALFVDQRTVGLDLIDASAAAAANAAVVGVGGQVQLLFFGDVRQQLLQQETRIGIAQAVVLEAPVAASSRCGSRSPHVAR